MEFKKLFKDRNAVSPVIGVILMVAITVILAAAIGSSVFGTGSKTPAPQASLDIKANTTATATVPGSVKIEHLGGDTIHFGSAEITRVTASLNGAPSVDIDATGLDNMSVGDSDILRLSSTDGNNPFTGRPVSGDAVNIKVIDVKTNQLVTNKDIRF